MKKNIPAVKSDPRIRLFFILAFVVLAGLIILAFCLGRYSMSPTEFFQAVFQPGRLGDRTPAVVIRQVRLPRILMAVILGAGLAAAGAAFQSIFGNPLVSENILGVSAGAGFGAALGILFLKHVVGIQLSAALFGMLSVFCTYRIARRRGEITVLMLVLSGVIVGSLFSSALSILKYFVADHERDLPNIVFWLMGSLAGSTLTTVLRILPVVAAALIILFKIRWRLNILSLDEEEATSLGINVKRSRAAVIILATLIAAAAVSAAGIISFIGLVTPHLTRMLIGSDNKYVVPGAMLNGAVFLLLVDTLSRTLTGAEIPLSILTSLIGVPFFAYLLHKTGGVWND